MYKEIDSFNEITSDSKLLCGRPGEKLATQLFEHRDYTRPGPASSGAQGHPSKRTNPGIRTSNSRLLLPEISTLIRTMLIYFKTNTLSCFCVTQQFRQTPVNTNMSLSAARETLVRTQDTSQKRKCEPSQSLVQKKETMTLSIRILKSTNSFKSRNAMITN
jgi:hypothetical protein